MGCINTSRRWISELPCRISDEPYDLFKETTIAGIGKRIGDKIFVSEKGGVRIIPKDNSYRRFISNSMYDNNGNR